MRAHRTPLTLAAILAAGAVPGIAAARGESHRQVALAQAATACAGLPDGHSWTFSAATVEAVAPIFQNTRGGRKLAGASLTLRDPQGATASDVERAIRCQIARNALAPARDRGPLAVEGARARVLGAGAGRFVVQVWSDYAGAGPEILARSQPLATHATR
jgi:hypothetical protein